MRNRKNLIHSFAKTLLITLLCTFGVGEMWAEDSQHTQAVACDNPNNYPNMKINIKRYASGDCWEWGGPKGDGWESYDMSKAGITFEGKQLFAGEYWTCNGLYNLQYQMYDANGTWKEQVEEYAGSAVYDYFNNRVYDYDNNAYYTTLNFQKARIYFDATGWEETDIKFTIGHANFQRYYGMSPVTGTNLYFDYLNLNDAFSDAMGCGVVGNTTASDGTNWLTNVSSKANEYTGYRHYGMNNNGSDFYYLIVNNGKAGQYPDMSNGDNYTDLNSTQTFYTVVKEAGGSYSSAYSKATIDISSYELTGQGSTTARASSISTSASSATITACRTANTRLQVGTPATGYQFDGWWTEATTGSKESDLSDYTYNPTEATTLYARFSAKNYTITLDRNGGTGDNQQVTATYNSSSLSAAVTAPERSGYTFAGWYTNNGGADGVGDLVINPSGVLVGSVAGYTDGSANWIHDSNVRLYARWKNNNNIYAYNIQYGSGPRYGTGWTVESFTQVGATNEFRITNFTMPDPSVKTKFFIGYNEDFYSSGLGTATPTPAASAEHNMTAMRLDKSWTGIGTATGAVGKLVIWQNQSAYNLSVRFCPNGFGLTYHTGTLEFSAADGNTMRQTSTVTLSSDDVSGTFKVGLATATEGTYVDCAKTATEDKEDLNDRADALEENDDYPAIPELEEGLKGRFVMWENNTGTNNNWNLSFLPVYIVSYNANGGTGDAPASATEYLHNDDVTVLANSFTRSGYTFAGWNTDADGTSGDDYAASDKIEQINATTTLYAKWTETPYTITASTDGGGSVGATSYTAYVETTTTITASPATGYKFDHWEETGSTNYVTFDDENSASTTITATGAAAIKAVFVSSWSVAGGWSGASWDKEVNTIGNITTDEGVTSGYVEITLPANTTYNFKVWDKTGHWYGYATAGTILTYANSGTAYTMATSPGENMSITTAGAGNYTFTWNITSKELTVTYPNSWTVTYGWTAGMPSPGTGVTASVGGNALASGGYVTEGSDVTFTETHPTGFTLTGWYTTQDGDDEVSGMSTSDNVLDNIGANATVYAKYTENHFDVTAAASPATGGIVTPASATSFGQYYGGDISATPYIGYSFTGWTGGTGDYVNESLASTKFKPTATSTVTAGFTRCYAFIEGRLRVRTSDRSSTITVGAGGTWGTTSSMMPMDYDDVSHRFYRRTYSTPAELQVQVDDKDQFFFIHTSTASGSVTGGEAYYAPGYPDNRLPSAGTKVALSTSNSAGVAFSGSENAYVIIYFDGTNVWYELEPTFTGTVSGHETEWSNTGNWTTGELPTINEVVYINKPVMVDIEHAAAKGVILNRDSPNTGKLTIQANKGLEVLQTVQVYDGSSYGPTTAADLVLESSSSGNASLVFNNSNSCAATVEMYSPATISTNWNWQFMGTPFTSANALYSYYGAYLYEWQSTGTWDAVANGGTMTPFTGYCITQDAATTYTMDGTLNPNDDVVINIPAGLEFVMANSWSAPIFVSGFTNTTLPLTDQNIYLFNTGHNTTGATSGSAPGTYVAIPIHAAPYTGNDLIAPMEGFYVDNRGHDAATITLKYDELVRPQVDRDIVAGPMHAPKRVAADNEPDVMKIKATGSRYSERIVILAREDFSTGFDNGWDGKNLNEPGVAPILYALRADGTKDAVSAIPNYEGTVVGFRKGEDSQYTFSFDYDGAEMLYLNDLKQQTSTLIDAEHSYTFTTAADDAEARFIISASPIAKTPTGIEGTEYRGRNTEVRKLMIDGVLYIIRGGRMYNAIGLMIK